MVKLPAYLTGFNSKADGSASIRFSTQELQPQDFAELHGHLNQFGWLAFRENELQDEDIPDEDAAEDKSPSKRMRAVLFVLWNQEGKQGDFESFYRDRMEKLITAVKGKLDA